MSASPPGGERKGPGLLLVILAVAAFFGPRLLRGEVVFPHDNAVEVGAASAEEAGEPEPWGVHFSDASSFYWPELAAHLAGPRSGWIATWTDQVGMGRPLTHLSGLSPAYLPTRVLAWLVDDPLELLSLLTVLTVLATGVFAYAFLRELELDPRAALCGALAASLGPPMLWWLTFPMNPAAFCWTFALLWLVARWLERPHPGGLVALAFAVQALLLSGYPQLVVWLGAFVLCWTLARIHARRASGARLAAAGALSAAVAAGVLAALPVMLDVRLALARSPRSAVDPEYFLRVLPELHSLGDALRYAATIVDPWLVGDPRAEDFPVRYAGISAGLFVALAALASGAGGSWRRLRTAYVFVVLGAAMTFFPALYRFGVEHLGLSLSRTLPTVGGVVPGILCAAVGVDRLLVAGARERRRAALVGALVVVALGVARARSSEGADALPAVLGFVGFAALAWRRAGWIAAAALAASLWVGSRDTLLMRPRASIRLESELVEAVRARTAGGGRFVLVGREPRRVLPANQELALGLASVHTYDSLLSFAYRDWVQRVFGAESLREKRFTRALAPRALEQPELDSAGIALVLARERLRSSRFRPVGRTGPFELHEPIEPPWSARLDIRHGTSSEAGAVRSEPASERVPVEIVADEGDRLRLAFAPQQAETLLRLARQFHPQWRTSAGRAVLVDGFYQGVLVPPGTDALELAFRPWVRFAWIPQLAFVVAGAAAVLLGLRRRAPVAQRT